MLLLPLFVIVFVRSFFSSLEWNHRQDVVYISSLFAQLKNLCCAFQFSDPVLLNS